MELLVNGHKTLSKAKDFQVSVLCLCGTNDSIIDPASVKEFHDSIQVKDKTYTQYPHAQHRLLEDNEQGSVYEYIVNWLKECI